MSDYRIDRETSTEMRLLGKNFINAHHSYIKWSDRPSRKLYWNLYENNEMVGVFALGSAFSKPKVVSEFMLNNNISFNEMANNIVFCLYNTKDKNSGTKLLSMLRKDAILWWHERYNDTLRAFQTFILPPRTGSVYKADNWKEVGITSGNTQIVRTIKKKDYEENKELYDSKHVETRTFASGEVKYLIREFSNTDKKIIFIRLNSRKELYPVMNNLQLERS